MYLPLKIIKILPKMSFPPGPPLHLPGMPPPMIPPPYGVPPMGPMIPMTVGMMPAPMMGPVAMTMPPALSMPPHPKMTINKKPNIQHTTYKRENQETPDIMRGPPVTVFVGNITDRAPDNLVRQILQRCGIVLNWKRVQGANGKLQAFGFCEYGEPEAALRAIRLLHDYEIGNKKLVVKVDAKTKEKLDEYKAKVWAKQDDEKETKDTEKEEGEESDDTLDEMTKQRDDIIKSSLESLIRAHESELSKPAEPPDSPPPVIINPNPPSNHHHHHHRSSNQENSSPKPRIDFERLKKTELDEMDLEEDKKSLIHREIDKFRDTYKRAEEEKEKDNNNKEQHSSSSSSRQSRRRDYDSPEPSRTRDRDRERERERERRHRERGASSRDEGSSSSRRRRRSRERSTRSPRASPVVTRETRERSRERPVERSRSVSRDREWAREREREHSNESRSKEKEYDKEEEEEAYERKKQERKIREKEAVYQERLRNWEARERRKNKDYEKERLKAEEQKKDEIKEARRLKEFLEDYDDERDDPKYFKGSALLRRMKEREKEIEDDLLDRQREKEELDDLRKKLMEEGHPDPEAEVERFLQEESRLTEPSLKEETPDSDQEPAKQPSRAKMKPIPKVPVSPPEPSEPKPPRERKMVTEDDNTQNSFSGFSDLVAHEEAKPLGFTSLRIGGSPTQPATAASPATVSQNNTSSTVPLKRKMTIDEVFNANDEDETEQKKKRKLIPLDDSQDDNNSRVPSAIAQMSIEEKRKHIKNLIEKIPTEKNELFAYTLDWSMVDEVLMEKRIRPWINKKIIEYIGEEEPTLVEFICSKVMDGSAAQSILNDVSMVLDEEAEVFVVKMWRLLIYEIEAKKLGLVCKTSANSQPENTSSQSKS